MELLGLLCSSRERHALCLGSMQWVTKQNLENKILILNYESGMKTWEATEGGGDGGKIRDGGGTIMIRI